MFEYFDIDLTKASFEILFVVCSFRDQNVIRMISARLATAPEKERYEYGEDDYE